MPFISFSWKRTTNQPKDEQTCRQTNNGQPRLGINTTGKVHINLILMRVRLTTLSVEKQKAKILHIMRVCLYSCLSYPARKALAPYCHLWPARLKTISPHYLINGINVQKKLLNIKYMF